MTLLIFANDFATMSLATDNVKYTSNPNKWNIKNITLASLVIGSLLVIEDVIGFMIGKNYFKLEWEKLQSFIMLLLVFNSQFRVYIVRERRRFWSSKPGKGLIISIIAVILGFTFLGMHGMIIPPLSLFQVFFILTFTGAIIVGAIDYFKHLTFKKLQL
jgi:H+-transporting ATPase